MIDKHGLYLHGASYERGFQHAICQATEILESRNSEIRKLRQAVKDLTASSEKLREINSKATAQALKLETENKKYRDGGLRGLFRNAQFENLNLRRELERQSGRQQVFVAFPHADVTVAVASYEREICRLTAEIDRLKRLIAQVGDSNIQLIDQVRNLEAANAAWQKQSAALREKIRPLLFAAADLYAGHPVTKIGIDP